MTARPIAADIDLAPRVRPPVQERSRRAWTRILDAGVEVLSEVGANRFTIAAVCERAGVAPTAVYARTDSRDDLLYAVYDHGMSAIESAEITLLALADKPDPRAAVLALTEVFEEHEGFLRATVLSSGEHDYIAARGVRNIAAVRGRFVAAAVGSGASRQLRTKAETVFTSAFSVLCLGIAYGPQFIEGIAMHDSMARQADLAQELLQPASRKPAGPRSSPTRGQPRTRRG